MTNNDSLGTNTEISEKSTKACSKNVNQVLKWNRNGVKQATIKNRTITYIMHFLEVLILLTQSIFQ